MRIGVFDSGFGGCTILVKLMEYFPGHDYVYLGDNANAPYGDKTQEEISRLTSVGLEFLFEQEGCELCVAGCNTANIYGNLPLDSTYGVIEPTLQKAAQIVGKRVGIIATTATIESGFYERGLRALRPDVDIWTVAAPKLAANIELGVWSEEEKRAIVWEYIEPFVKNQIDTLLLGCTHYPVLLDVLRDLLGPEVRFVESGEAFCELYRDVFLQQQGSKGSVKFITTADPEWFRERLQGLFPELGKEAVRHA